MQTNNSQRWIQAALTGLDKTQAAAQMGCSPATAQARLEEARRVLDERRDNCEKAVGVLLQSEIAPSLAVPRRQWSEVALGLRAV